MRRWIIRVGICGILLLIGLRVQAQPQPSKRLVQVHPILFSGANLVDAAISGELGARLVQVTEGQRALGFLPGDVIVAVEGRRLAGKSWSPDAILEARSRNPDAVVFTVWRTVTGDRPVVERAHLGREAIEQFSALPERERTPMRLAVMLANQSTLVHEGLGVLLLPAPTPYDESVWLRVANPLPPTSETALREMIEAVIERVRLSKLPSGSELEAARSALEKGRFLEAEERARRAMALAVRDPSQRKDPSVLGSATSIYTQAIAGSRRRRAELLAPGKRLALVLDARLNGIQAFLPQNTLLLLNSSKGFGVSVGLRMRVVSSLHLFGSFGFAKNRFGGESLPQTVTEQMALETRLLEWRLGYLYRVRVASRLRPFFRADAGLYALRARVECGGTDNPDRIERTAARKTTVGLTLGGGIDLLHWKSRGLRGSVQGSYRILEYSLRGDETPMWAECEQITHTYFPVLDLDGGYKLDMNAWQLGFLWSLDL